MLQSLQGSFIFLSSSLLSVCSLTSTPLTGLGKLIQDQRECLSVVLADLRKQLLWRTCYDKAIGSMWLPFHMHIYDNSFEAVEVFNLKGLEKAQLR